MASCCNKLGGLLRQSASQTRENGASMLSSLRWMSSTRVFVKVLAKRNVDEQFLKEVFSWYVKIVGRGKFGFVNFANSKAASDAVMDMDRTELWKGRG